MVRRKGYDFRAAIDGHKRAAVAHVCHVRDFAYDQNNDGTRAASLDLTGACIAFLVRIVQEGSLSLLEASLHGLNWILGELRIADDELVELVSEEVSALRSPVTVVNREKRAAWPVVDLLELWLDDV